MTAADDVHALLWMPTPMIADAMVRLGLPPRQAPAGLIPPGPAAIAGPARPVRHSGSVDVFLEALEHANHGDVMVIDNAGRLDEACIGDLIAHEVKGAGLAGIVIWGLHRDAVEVAQIGLPVFSYGTVPYGPLSARDPYDDRFTVARFGDGTTVTAEDIVVADTNGAVFFEAAALPDVLNLAGGIRDAEAAQVAQLQQGVSLRQQFGFDEYLTAREHDPQRTFRQHLRQRNKAVEE